VFERIARGRHTNDLLVNGLGGNLQLTATVILLPLLLLVLLLRLLLLLLLLPLVLLLLLFSCWLLLLLLLPLLLPTLHPCYALTPMSLDDDDHCD